MKYFYLTITLIWSAFGVFNVLCDTTCQTEIENVIANVCGPTTPVNEMILNYFKYRDNEIDRAEFKSLAEAYCTNSLYETNCILENTTSQISDDCKTSTYYDISRNEAKYYNTFSQYFCENDQTRYMNTIDDGGVDCLFNRNFASCLREFQIPEDPFTSGNICRFLEMSVSCEHHFNDCINPNIKTYRPEMFRLLQVKLNC